MKMLIVDRYQFYHCAFCNDRNVRCALRKKEWNSSTRDTLHQTFSEIRPKENPTMKENKCTTFFLALAIILDVIGFLLLLVGIFAPLSYWDFFVFSGSVLIFLSLVLWIFWYMGNLTVPEEELNLPKHDILWVKEVKSGRWMLEEKWERSIIRVKSRKRLLHSLSLNYGTFALVASWYELNGATCWPRGTKNWTKTINYIKFGTIMLLCYLVCPVTPLSLLHRGLNVDQAEPKTGLKQ